MNMRPFFSACGRKNRRCQTNELLGVLLQLVRVASLTRKGPGLVSWHRPEALQVPLVAHQHHHDVGVAVIVQLLQPALGALVRQVLADVVDQQGPHGAAVIPLGGGGGEVRGQR